VAETVCAFAFADSAQWDLTLPGLLWEKFRDEYPRVEPINTMQVTVSVGLQQVTQQPGVRFLSEDRKGIVQLAPNQLSIHRVNGYMGWVNFRPQILGALDLYREIAKPAGVARIGLRYLNHVELPVGTIELQDYFRLAPEVPEPIPQGFSAFLTQMTIPYLNSESGLPESSLRITFGTADSDQPDKMRFILDLDMSTPEGPLAVEAAADWLDTSHARLDEAFTAAFTEKTHREIFEEYIQ
jgi:uncharacterized protein (TIGR04255 family)